MSVDIPDSIGFLIVDLARLFRHRFAASVSRSGLTVTAGEARTLLHADMAGTIRQAALADRMQVEPMTLCRFLDRLEEAGLIARETDPTDRRAKQIRVTKNADVILEQLRRIATEVREDGTAGMSDAEVTALRHSLQIMRRRMSDPAGEVVS